MKNFETRYIVDVPKSGRSRTARVHGQQRILQQRDNVAENPKTSVRARYAQERIYNAARGGHLADILYIMLRNKLPKCTKKLINLVLFKNNKSLKR